MTQTSFLPKYIRHDSRSRFFVDVAKLWLHVCIKVQPHPFLGIFFFFEDILRTSFAMLRAKDNASGDTTEDLARQSRFQGLDSAPAKSIIYKSPVHVDYFM